MPEYSGYRGGTLGFLKRNGIGVGDSVRIRAGATYEGIVMPRHERGDDGHLVVKLGSGYNVGLETAKIEGIERELAGPGEETGRAAARAAREGLPRILLLSTGGTIASRVDYRTGAVTPTLAAADLLESVPELGGIANVETEELFSEHSENMAPAHWTAMAERIAGSSGYDGIMVAHGTDTMHYTSSFLSFALAGFQVPVVLVGSQRSSDRASSDAAANLVGAARLIAGEGPRGVWVAMHLGEGDGDVACHAGTRVRKNHTSARGAFETVGANPAFVVSEGGIRRNMEGDYFSSSEFAPRTGVGAGIALVKYHPGYDPGTLDQLVDSGCRGIIFEGTGLGHVGRPMYEGIGRARDRGVFMGMTSQCIAGRVNMDVYESGRDLQALGVVPLGDMIPETALVKAMWAAGNFEDIGAAMGRVVASEMTR